MLTLQGKTAAVIVEPVQGEGGIHMSSQAYLEGLRELCDEAGALLIFDEIQCGLGRTGKLWAHEYFGVQPDMMTLAKPLAGAHPSDPPKLWSTAVTCDSFELKWAPCLMQ